MSKRRRRSNRRPERVRSRVSRRQAGFVPRDDISPVEPVRRREVRQVVAANRQGRARFVFTRSSRAALQRTRKLELANRLTGRVARKAVRAAGLKNAPAMGKKSNIAVRASEKRSEAFARKLGMDPRVLCQERRERRATLFQIGVAGRGKRLSPGPYVNDVLSWVNCKRR